MLDDLSADDYIGDAADRTGFSGLEAVDEVTMVAVPDLMAALEQGAIDLETVKAVQLGVIAHCELMGDRMAILDPPPGSQRRRQVGLAASTRPATTRSSPPSTTRGSRCFDPAIGPNRFIPPSGHIAGVWARNDNERGVHKAPANEVIRGAVALQTQLTNAEQELLNPIGVNGIRSFPGRGVRVWGARTLSSDPAWRYLNVRRLFNYLEKSILNATQFAVFEPNDPALWGSSPGRSAPSSIGEWRKGALFGRTPDEAFFVKCDDETNPADVIDAGQVVCQIGVAPGEAGRVRGLPALAVLGRHEPRHRMIRHRNH